MATRYDSFAVFMAEVVEQAKKRITSSNGITVLGICITILQHGGWLAFLSVCGLLVLGYIGFGVAIVPFLATGPFAAVIAGCGGGAALWALWKNKKLPLAVKAVGEQYKSRYESAKGNYRAVEALQTEAIDSLVSRLYN